MDASKNDSPIDKWHIIKIVFILHGISALLPWNMLINADSYFIDYKLIPSNQTILIINTGNSSTMFSFHQHSIKNSSETLHSNALENYRRNFLPYLSTASKAPNIIFQLINLLFSSSSKSYKIRMHLTFIVQIAIFVIMVALAFIDTSSWPEIFFWITIIIAVLFNMVNGIFQSCIYGIVAKFPMKYINYVTFGFSFSGTIASIFLIISLLLSSHPRTVAIYYFSFATIFMLFCYTNEIFISRNKFFRKYFYESDEKLNHQLEIDYQNPSQMFNNDLINGKQILKNEDQQKNFMKMVQMKTCPKQSKLNENTNRLQTYLLIIRKCWIQLLNIILIYIASFAIFPAIQANIRPLDSIVESKLFVPIFCFLFFNTFSSIGNYVAERIRKPRPHGLIYWVLFRFLFVPFFFFCNYLPERRKWPVLIQNDITYIFGSILMAFSSGYTSSLAMMYAPKSVMPKFASISGMLASAAVIIGIIIGVQCSMFLQLLVT